MPQIIVAPVATLSEFETSFNNAGELVITAKDANGNDISRASLIIPPGPFCLVYSPIAKDWNAIPLKEFPDGYQLVQTIIGVE